MRKRVLLFVEGSLYPSYGGSKRFLVNLTSGLDRSRFEPRALFYREGPWIDDLERQDVRTHLIARSDAAIADPTAPHGPASPRRRPWKNDPTQKRVKRNLARQLAWDVRSLWNLHRRTRREAERLLPSVPDGIDLIQYNGPMHMAFEWYHVARLLRVPLLTRENGVWRKLPAACHIVAPRLGAAVCLTAERVEALRRWGHGRVPTALIPNGIAPERLRPTRPRDEVRRKFGIAPGTALVLFVGHMQPWKGQYLGVEAAIRLLRESRDVVWIFCGSWIDPEYVRRLERQIREAGVEERVRILGERRDLPDLYAAADVAVLASIHSDPFPNVALEAMGSGLPLVAPRQGATAELVRDGQDGLLFTSRDAAALASAVDSLLVDREKRAAFGASARARVQADYTLQSMIEGHQRVYERVLGGGALGD